MNPNDICITGIGLATPLGHSLKDFAENLLQGRSGVQRISAFPVQDHPVQIGGTLSRIPCPEGCTENEFSLMPEVDRLALWCCTRALQDSGYYEQRSDIRLGLVLGSAADLLSLWETNLQRGGKMIFRQQDPRDSLVQRIRGQLEITGPSVSISAACASGNYALALAKRWLEMDWVDACLAGACDKALTPTTLACFGNLRALSRRNEAPQAASRPFDCGRDGFVMSEGGAMFLLEKAGLAKKRSAQIYARIAGCGASSDAFHMVIPSSDPGPAVIAMRRAFADARLDPSQIDYINAHATGTPVGDLAEARILETVFGPDLARVPCSSTKSMTGHLLTGAAAVEALACIVAMTQHAAPPTINLENPDPECRLRHVPNQAQERPIRTTLSNSFGFGGSNTCLILAAA